MQLYAFDILALGGDDLRKLPLSKQFERLLKRRSNGIFLAPFEQAEIGLRFRVALAGTLRLGVLNIAIAERKRR